MNLSIFFAKLLGIFLIFMAIVMAARKKYIESIVNELFASKSLLYFAGTLNLLIGLAIAIAHPIWEWNWKGLITLLGYLFIFKGMMRLGFPEQSKILEKKMLRGYWIIFAAVAISGIYLTYSGFIT